MLSREKQTIFLCVQQVYALITVVNHYRTYLSSYTVRVKWDAIYKAFVTYSAIGAGGLLTRFVERERFTVVVKSWFVAILFPPRLKSSLLYTYRSVWPNRFAQRSTSRLSNRPIIKK